MDDDAKAAGLAGSGHVAVVSGQSESDNLYKNVEGLWIRNTSFGTDRHTGRWDGDALVFARVPPDRGRWRA